MSDGAVCPSPRGCRRGREASPLARRRRRLALGNRDLRHRGDAMGGPSQRISASYQYAHRHHVETAQRGVLAPVPAARSGRRSAPGWPESRRRAPHRRSPRQLRTAGSESTSSVFGAGTSWAIRCGARREASSMRRPSARRRPCAPRTIRACVLQHGPRDLAVVWPGADAHRVDVDGPHELAPVPVHALMPNSAAIFSPDPFRPVGTAISSTPGCALSFGM